MKVEKLINLLKEKQLNIGCVESLTCGMFAKSFGDIPGASGVFKGGVVTYATELKEKIIGVNKEIINKHGVVSKEVAMEMASKGLSIIGADIVISFTGNAGPTKCEGNAPVGNVFIGLANCDGTTFKELNFKGNRNAIRKKTCNEGFKLIYDFIKDL